MHLPTQKKGRKSKETFHVNGEKMTPGISVINSDVGLASLSIATFMLRLVCTNGMISKIEVSASYRHVSAKILSGLLAAEKISPKTAAVVLTG
jgi:hypothetical protein